MSQVELSIVMPCLNEARTLASCIAKARAYLDQSGCTGEIVIADNGSSDGSIAIAESGGARVVHVEARGYGAACLAGIKAARGKYVILGDSDGSYDFSSVGGFHAALRSGTQVVIGNRFQGGIMPGAMPLKNRLLGNPILSLLGRILAANRIGDFHCGLRGVHRDSIIALDLRSTGMEFASELIIRAAGNRLSMTEVPTTLHPDGRGRPPHLRPWRDGWRHLSLLCILAPQKLLVVPGLAMFLAGMIGLAGAMSGQLQIGHAGLDIGGMLCFALVLSSGFQLFISGTLVKEILPANAPGNTQTYRLLTLNHVAPMVVGLLLGSLACFGVAFEKWWETGFAAMPSMDHARLIVLSLITGILSIQIFAAGLAADALHYSKVPSQQGSSRKHPVSDP